jgi:hypothetical protein
METRLGAALGLLLVGAACSPATEWGGPSFDAAADAQIDIAHDNEDDQVSAADSGMDGTTPDDSASDHAFPVDGVLESAPPADSASDSTLPADSAIDSDAHRDDGGSEDAGCTPCAVPVCVLAASSSDAGACAAGASGLDSDGDGLSDAWEQAGFIDMNCNGVLDASDIALPSADPFHKDIYVRYDYMANADHSHQPPQKALDQVKEAFAAHDIALHWIAPAGSIAEHLVTTRDSDANASCAGSDFVTMKTLRAAAFAPVTASLGPALQHPAYHYLVFAHNVTLPDTALDGRACPIDPECGGHPDPTASGSADVVGDDAIVGLGYWVDSGFTIGIETWAGTIMHELGHNLGLKHGSLAAPAPQTCNTTKPNYMSVMGYSYQSGIVVAPAPGSKTTLPCNSDADCNTGVCAIANACHCTDDLGNANVCYRIDYANTTLRNLSEATLDESVGVGGPSADQDLVVYCARGLGCALYGPSFGPIDWNNANGIETNVSADIDNDGSSAGLLLTTSDWDKLVFTFQCSSNWGAGAPAGQRTGTAELGLAQARRDHMAYPPWSVRFDDRRGPTRPAHRD